MHAGFPCREHLYHLRPSCFLKCSTYFWTSLEHDLPLRSRCYVLILGTLETFDLDIKNDGFGFNVSPFKYCYVNDLSQILGGSWCTCTVKPWCHFFCFIFVIEPCTLPKFNSKSPRKNDGYRRLYIHSYWVLVVTFQAGAFCSCETSASVVSFHVKKKHLKRFAASHPQLPFVAAALPAQLPNSRRPAPDLSTAFGFPTSPAMTQTLGRRDDELTPMAGATGTSALEAPPNLVVGSRYPPPETNSIFAPWKWWRFQVRKLQTSSLSIFRCELLVSGSVSPYAHCPLGPCFFQQVDFGRLPTLRFPWRKLCNVICLDLPGGFKHVLWSILTSTFFSDGLVQPPTSTPCKINMEPQTGGLEDDFPFQNRLFWWSLTFLGNSFWSFWVDLP